VHYIAFLFTKWPFGRRNTPPAKRPPLPEWLMKFFASKVIRKKGGEHLNLSDLNRWFKYNFGHEFSKLFEKLNILSNRKIDPLRFLHKRMRETEQWMEKKNGRR